MRLPLLVLVATIGMSAPRVASAQAASLPLAPGATVRVWSPELPRRQWAAVLGVWDADSLGLHAPTRRGRAGVDVRPQWVVSRHSVTRLDVLVPRTRKEGARTWGLIGLAGGALTGAALGVLAAGLGAEYYPNGTDRPGVSPLVFSVPIGAAVGGALGVLTGAAEPGKRWRTVPLGTLDYVSP